MKCPLTFLSSVSGLVVDIDEKEVLGRGGPFSPGLQISLKLELTYPFKGVHFALEIREVRGRLVVANEYLSSRVSVIPHYIRVTAERPRMPDQLVQLDFPLDLAQLTWMERKRKGGNMALRLELEVLADQWVALGQLQQVPATWGLTDHHRVFHNLDLEIPRSTWIERVLPGTGYGTVHLLELPVIPVERCAAIEPAIAALEKARKLLNDGHWDDAVGKCRVALDPFFEPKEITTESGAKKVVPMLKSSWETRLGKATYDWLNASLVAIKEPINKPHHSPKSYFDEVSAQMLLAVTTALVAYAARTVENPDMG